MKEAQAKAEAFGYWWIAQLGAFIGVGLAKGRYEAVRDLALLLGLWIAWNLLCDLMQYGDDE